VYGKRVTKCSEVVMKCSLETSALGALWVACYRNITLSVRNVRMTLGNKNHHLLSLTYNSHVREQDSAFLLRAKTNIRKFLNLQRLGCKNLIYRCFIFLISRLNPSTPELKHSAQRCLPRFLLGFSFLNLAFR
jgi:hypothetical protein